MVSPFRRALPARSVVSLFAAIAAISGVAAWLRLDADERIDLLLVATLAIAVGVVLALYGDPLHRTIAAGAIVAGAGTELLQGAPGAQFSGARPLVWLFLLAGIIVWNADRPALLRYVFVPVATLAVLIPVLDARLELTAPADFARAIAPAIACLAFGVAIERSRAGHGHDSGSRILDEWNVPRWLPSALLWAATGTFSIGVAMSVDRTWTALAMLATSAVLLCESNFALGSPSTLTRPDPGADLAAVGLVAVVCSGALVVASLASGSPFGWPTAGIATLALGSLIVLGREQIGQYGREFAKLRRAALESRTDALTGLKNRREFDERLRDELTRAGRYAHPLSLLMIDIDDFKLINDRFGHSVGDAALQSVANAIEESIRSIDIAARYGGEEFVVILPETPLHGAAIVAERIRAATAEYTSPYRLTVSIGVAELAKSDETPDAFLVRADAALYRAKSFGKNRVALAD